MGRPPAASPPGRLGWTRRWPRGLGRAYAPETLPVRLNQRRIYIAPTRAGCGFGVVLATMLVGALNYQNNAAMLLTCMLGAALAGSMLPTWRELHDLTLRSLHPGHGFCGTGLPLHLEFSEGGRTRPAVKIAVGHREQCFRIGPGSGSARLTLATERRGWIDLPRLKISSTLPFGLFRAWSWITPAQRALVYPRVLGGARPPAHGDDLNERSTGGDEFAGLRDYRLGDPVHHIAWKTSAGHDRPLVREFDHAAPGQPLRLDWHDLRGLDRETRISRLAAWVCDAHAQGRPWVLILEDRRSFGPASDAAHYHHCLGALAELP